MSEEAEGLSIARAMAATADKRYSELAEGAERHVARWEWYDFHRYSLEPCYFELHKSRPGEPLAGEPDPPVSGACGYAFNTDGMLIAERGQTQFPGRYYQTFYVHDTEGIARYYFDYHDAKWINVAWLSRNKAGHIHRIDSVYARGNFISELFDYDSSGRVIRAHRQGPNPPYGGVNDVRDIEYDEHGRVSKVVWVYPDGRRVLDFERPAPDRTLSHCREALCVALTDAILAALRDAAPEAPVAAVALTYVGAEYEHRLPPTVAFTTELYPDDDLDVVWSPADWNGSYLELQLGEQLSSLCHTVSNDIWQNALFAEVDALLWDIARKLSASEFPVPRSEAFVAYVTQQDVGNHASDVRRAASAATQALLSRMKLL